MNKSAVGPDAFINSPNWSIHSVKRLSDGEIFNIGDYTNFGKIKEFKLITENNITSEIAGNLCFTENINKIAIRTGDCLFANHLLDDVKICKIPLFTTEDGVDIYENIKLIYVSPNYDVNLHCVDWDINTVKKCMQSGGKYFSTKQAAEEYLLTNKPCLSINDVLKIDNYNNISCSLLEKLKSLVKIKYEFKNISK